MIVPVYNVAPYIEKCARSLLEQTLENMEIIFVDDKTPDNSIEIINSLLDNYPSRKSQTKIIHKRKNEGLAAARKDGILAATGEYIIHCDSDDWADTTLYRTLYEKAKETGADIVICDEVYEYNGYFLPVKSHSFLNN